MSIYKRSQSALKQSITAHSRVGLAFAVLLYVVCLTGTLSVFFEEFERWEQPLIEEYRDYSLTQIQAAISHFQQRVEAPPETLWVVLPTRAVPRIHISDGEQEWFVNADGRLSAPPLEAWTAMLTKLHMQLYLPSNIGLIVVGILGVILSNLTLSGLLAHPNMFKDAFRWRGGRQVLSQLDLHNRLGVWAAPFILVIALTGAFIGLLGLFGFMTSAAFYEGRIETVLEKVYGADPEVRDAVAPLDFAAAFTELKVIAPDARPLYIAIQHIDTSEQYFEIAATLPQRLIYSEIYRFRANGSLIDSQGFADGAAGRQIAYSVYRLHFGHFGGFWVKVVYAILGLALTIVCASGINIWLARRKYESVLNDTWVAVVWGLPLALAVAALLSFYNWGPWLVFCGVQSLALAIALLMKHALKTRWVLMVALILSLLAIVVSQSVSYYNDTLTLAFHGVNAAILVAALILSAILYRQSGTGIEKYRLQSLVSMALRK